VEALSTLGRFLVLQELGQGGMGAVFIGYEPERRKLVVLKTLFDHFAKEPDLVLRFQREATVYKTLDHPNIVRFIDSGCDKGIHFIAMEYIKSRPLDQVLKFQGRFAVPLAVKILGILADAVAHAHEKGVIHRDLKPENILYAEDGVLKLLDFGIARAQDELLKTAEGSILGTFQYAAPEQNQGKRVDERSDLYALGAILYEMVTGRRPVAGTSHAEVARNQITAVPTPPSRENPEVTRGLDRVILKLLERDPNNRFKTAREFIHDLHHYKEDGGAGTPAAIPASGSPLEQAQAAYTNKDYDRALELAKAQATAKPDAVELQVLLGKIYAAKNFKKPSMDAFKKAMTLQPNVAQHALDFGMALYTLRAWDEAETAVKRVIELEPDNAYASRYLRLIGEARLKTSVGSGGGLRRTGKVSSFSDSGIRSEIVTPPPPVNTPSSTPTTPPLSPPSNPPSRPPLDPTPIPSPLAQLAQPAHSWVWGLGRWRKGQRVSGALLVVLQSVLVLGILVPIAFWPQIRLDFSAMAKESSNPDRKALYTRWHDEKLDERASEFLNGPLRWVTLSVATALVVLIQLRVMGRSRSRPTDHASRDG
jgi:serine/threonine protein kinase